MARAGTAIGRFAFALLAATLSVALFVMLLRAPPRWTGAGGPMITATLVNEREQAAADPSQTHELAAAAPDYSPGGRDARRSESGDESRYQMGDQGIDDYVPASKLSERPQVLQDIDPEWRLPGVQLPVLVSLLLINEYGDVDRVLLEEQPLSPMLKEDIRSRFLAMRFRPGRLHGKPVKSVLRIEVRLE